MRRRSRPGASLVELVVVLVVLAILGTATLGVVIHQERFYRAQADAIESRATVRDAAVAHALERQAFGHPLAALQGVSHQLADVATRVQASRLLVHSAAAAHDAGITPITEAAAMAKLFATETAAMAVDVAIQVHGARALERGHLLEHLYREVRGIRIYEGASEVQREIIARQLFRQAGRGS